MPHIRGAQKPGRRAYSDMRREYLSLREMKISRRVFLKYGPDGVVARGIAPIRAEADVLTALGRSLGLGARGCRVRSASVFGQGLDCR